MTIKATALLAAFILGTTPVWAGELKYSDGKGSWQPTMCAKPARPADLPKDPEAASADLNDRVQAYNLYAAQSQAYFDCIAKEVERDAQGAQYVLSESSKKLTQSLQEELTGIQEQLQRQKTKKKRF